ncbi:hypothetical protein HYT02_05755 [Candidatus Gottesmanbacteria bacterium]|nr:hypothetical protein [Candidatus Gottesmanbacteria bacterium]
MDKYKVTFYQYKVKLLGNISTENTTELEKYINNFSSGGYELLSTSSMHPLGILCIWKKI